MTESIRVKPSAILARIRRRTPYGSLGAYCRAHRFSYARAGSLLIGRIPPDESVEDPRIRAILRSWIWDSLIQSPSEIGLPMDTHAIFALHVDPVSPRAHDYPSRGAHFLIPKGDA